LIRDPAGRIAPQALLSTKLDCDPGQILRWFIQCWQLETTFEEATVHGDLETSCQWNDRSIARTTPAVSGFTRSSIAGGRPIRDQQAPVRRTTWYANEQASFSDMIALVRRRL
jgi:hypothetical protein